MIRQGKLYRTKTEGPHRQQKQQLFSLPSDMDLFALPPEIRLKIYAELLVHRGPIPFLGTSWANFKFRRFSEGTELYPTVLRVNRQVFEEAVPLLYAGNCFQFADPDATSAQCHTTIADFIRQIGAQAALLRHVCINFPALPLKQGGVYPCSLRSCSAGHADVFGLQNHASTA